MYIALYKNKNGSVYQRGVLIIMEEKKQNIDEKSVVVESNSQDAKNGFHGGIFAFVVMVVLAYLIYSSIFDFLIGKILVYMAALVAFIALLVGVSCYFDWKEAKKIETLEEDARKEEKEFSEIDPSKRELRAEKMFKMNQKELMRYYDMNLAQTKFLSGLGIIMIIFGMFIVVVTLILYILLELDKVLLLVGSISGIIVDFVGAIFIKMYTENIKAAVKFHEKFAESNNLLLANSIANKIENEGLREKTLSEISKEIIIVRKI